MELRDNPLRFVAVFKVKVLKKDYRRNILSIVQRSKESRDFSRNLSKNVAKDSNTNPILKEDLKKTIRKQIQSCQNNVEQVIQKTIQTAPTIMLSELLHDSHPTTNSSVFTSKPTIGAPESLHKDDENVPNPANEQIEPVVKTMDLNLIQLKRDHVIVFECNVGKNKDICFKVDDAIVSEITARDKEQLAYLEAKKHNDINNYLTFFPDGRPAGKLKEGKELQVYERCTTYERCEEYLKLYSEGKYSKEIYFRRWLFRED